MRTMTSFVCLRSASLAVILAAVVACSEDPEVAKKAHLEKGNQLFQQQRYREAGIEYRTAIQLDGRYAEARRKLAESYERLGDSGNALREYVRAADLLPNDPDTQVKAGTYLLATGMLEDASARAMKALKLKPEHVQARLLLAYATAGLKDLDSGAAQLEDLIRIDPSQPGVLRQLGSFRLAQGNLPQAEKAFLSAHALAPNSVDTLMGLADFHMATGRFENAEQWLQKARSAAPQDARVNRALAALYIRINRLPEAESPLRAYVDATPQAKARLLLADYYFAIDRRSQAREILEQLKGDEVTAADARIRLSVLAFVENRASEAATLIEEVLSSDPRNAQALTMKGRYLLLQSKPEEARAALTRAVDSDGNIAEAHYWLGVVYRQLGDNNAARSEFGRVQALQPSEVGSQLQLAQLSLLEGRPQAALDLANRAVTVQPNNIEARLTRVDALTATKDLKAALQEATRLASDAPASPQPQRQIGRIHHMQGAFAAAEAAYEKAVQLSGGALDIVLELVETRIASGRLVEARATIDDALKKNPKHSQLHIYSARVHKASRNSAQAERALQDALAADPSNLQAYLELSRMYIESRRLDEARKQLEALLARNPKQVWMQTLVGITFELENRKQEARDRYRKALEIDPRAPVAANNLAMIYADSGQDLNAALQLAQIAVQQLPNNAGTNDTLGWVYLKRNLPGLAVQPLEVSTKQEPDNPLYQYHLGVALLQTGSKVRARAALTRALALGKDFEGIAEARRLLATL